MLILVTAFWWIALVLWIGMVITVWDEYRHQKQIQQNYPGYQPSYKNWRIILFIATWTTLLIVGLFYLNIGFTGSNTGLNQTEQRMMQDYMNSFQQSPKNTFAVNPAYQNDEINVAQYMYWAKLDERYIPETNILPYNKTAWDEAGEIVDVEEYVRERVDYEEGYIWVNCKGGYIPVMAESTTGSRLMFEPELGFGMFLGDFFENSIKVSCYAVS